MEWLSAFAAETFTTQFLFAVLSIVMIDIVLAGDNAIVIAMAARRLPVRLQKKAILWGTVGAVVVRTLMTLAVVWLLKIPGLMLIGGLALLWIAWKLLNDQGGEHDEHGGDMSFFAALKTIVIADAVMGIDNVLAVAGAAHGSFLLVVAGLVISIPIMVWGSTLVLLLMRRFAFIIYIGAAILVITAIKMVADEPLVKAWFDAHAWAEWALFAVGLAGVLGGSYALARRRKPA